MAVQKGEGGWSSMNLWTASFFIFALKAPKMIRLDLGKESGSTETRPCTTAETREDSSHHSSQFRTAQRERRRCLIRGTSGLFDLRF